MKKLFVSSIVSLVLFVALLPSTSAAVFLTTTSHDVTITTTENGLYVVEELIVENNGNTPCMELEFWIQQRTDDLSILAKQTNTRLPHSIAGNVYSCNLTLLNLSIPPDEAITIQISYTLPRSVEYFQKTLSYDTTFLLIFFNKKELYRGGTLAPDASLQLTLYKPTEAPLNMIYIAAVLLLVILLIITSLLLLKKQRRKTLETKGIESKELLTIKKTILMEALKEIEKQHRARTISDETFTKLREDYKQQAVDAMKKLDDMQHTD